MEKAKYNVIAMDRWHKYISDATFDTEEEAFGNMQTVSYCSNDAYFFTINEIDQDRNVIESIMKDAVYVGTTKL